ncbi:MAG: PKD domain-containing protein [Bacteroidota bacterium]
MRLRNLLLFLLLLWYFPSQAQVIDVTLQPSSATVCAGSSVQLLAHVTGAVGAVSYTWTPMTGLSGPLDSIKIATPANTTLYKVRVIDALNHRDSATITVTVLPGPTAAFIFSPDYGCAGTSVTFINNSTAGNYSWDLGDGTTSTLQYPTHNYALVTGNDTSLYNATLIVTSLNNCTDTITHIVHVKKLPDASLIDPLTNFGNCANATFYNQQYPITVYNNSTTNNTSYKIIWGDGSPNFVSSGFVSASHTYNTLGVFFLVFEVTGANGCVASQSYLITNISNPAISFGGMGSTMGCTPTDVCFTIGNYQLNHNTTLYVVDFGDGSPKVTLTHPPPDTICHTYMISSCNHIGITGCQNCFVASITAKNACDSTKNTTDNIRTFSKIVAGFSAPPMGCVNQPMSFTNTSMGGHNYLCDTTGIYTWNFGDGTPPVVVAVPTPQTHIYTAPGHYVVTLIAENIPCGQSSFMDTVCINPLPVALFTLSDSVFCRPHSVVITNLTNLANICNQATFTWSITCINDSCSTLGCGGYTFMNGTSITSFSPQIMFNRPGKYTIRLTVNNGCNPPAVYSKVIRVKSKPTVSPPVIPAKICQGGSINPTAIFTPCYGSVTYLWSFPGGVPNSSTLANPGTISYSTPGSYTVTVKASNSCGDTTLTKNIIVKPLPAITQKPNIAVCPASTITIGNFSGSIIGTAFAWTNSNTAIGLGASGTGSIPAWTAPANNTGVSITGTITVIPTFDSCSGPPMTFTVTIYPTPVLSFVPNVAVCPGQPINFGNWISNVTGTTFTWTNNNTLIGIPASGNGDITPWNAPPNNTTSNIVGTITVRPTSPNGCLGPAISFTVTIYPTPTVTQLTNIAVCPGQSIIIPNFTGNLSGITYNWANSNTSIGLGASGSGNIPTWTAPANNTGASITGTITVTPVKNGCPGTPMTFTVTIYPTPSVNQVSNIAVCPLQPITIGNFVTVPAGATVTWTNSNTSIGLAASGSGNIPGWTAPINGTGANIVGTITVTPSVNGCTGPTMTFTVTIFPATAVQQISNITVCPGQTITPGNFVSMPAGATFTWTNSNTAIGIAASGSGNIAPWTAPPNGTLNPIVGTITVTPSSNGCPGSPMNFTVTINPIPDISASPMVQSICSNTSTAVSISSTYPGATFSWTVIAPGGVTGASAGSGSSIGQTLVNTNLTTDTVRYTITPAVGACSGASIVVKIAVYPKVIMTAVTSQSVCPGTTITIPAFASNLAGTTYAWTNTNTSIGLGASGAGSIPAWTAPANGTTSNITGTITVTPTSANGCTGTPVTFTVAIYPTPVITAVSDIYVCPAQSINIGSFISNLGGTTFNWVNSNTAIGLAASGSGNITAWTAPVNGTGVNISGTITVTPVKNGCPGLPISFTVNIYPTPVVSQESNIAVCPGTAISINNFVSAPSGASFTWTNSNVAIGLAASGSGNIAGWNAPANNTGVNIVGTVSVTASLSGCSGPVMSFTVTIYPTPVATQHSNITVCPGVQINIGNFSSTPAGATFAWTNSNTAIGLGANGTGTIPAWTAPSNNTFTNISGTISVVPSLNGCSGNAMNFTVNISPQPDVTATPMVQTICSNTAAVINLGSAYTGVSYSWTAASPLPITGASGGSGAVINQTLANSGFTTDTVRYTITSSLSGCSSVPIVAKVAVYPNVTMSPVSSINVCPAATISVPSFTSNLVGTSYAWTNSNAAIGLGVSGSGNIPSWTAPANNTTNNISGTITVTPTSPQGCAGSPITFTVTIYPTPTVNPVTGVSVCPGTAINAFSFSGNLAGTTFNWSNSNTAIGLGASGSGNIPGWTAPANSTNATISGTITVTPMRNGCSGTPITFIVNIYPTPTVNAISNIAVCPQQAISIPAFASTPAGSTFTWTNSNTAIGLGSIGAGNINGWNAPANNTGVNITGTITVTPSLNSCGGPVTTFTVTIYPTPTATPHSNITVCPGQQINIGNFSSTPAGSTFNWTNSNTTIGIGANGTGNIPSWTAPPNGTQSNISGTITVTPVLNGCTGNFTSFTVNIAPVPDVSASPLTQYICSNTLASVSISSTYPGTSFSWTVSAPPGISGASAGSGNAINQTLVNSTNHTDSLTYTITPQLGNCPGTPITVKVVVYSSAIPIATPTNQTICSGASTLINLTSNPPNASFSWVVSAPAGISGASAGSGSQIIQALTNSTVTPKIVNYTVTPQSNNCPGATVTIPITVNPLPQATASPAISSICSGATTSIGLTSTVAGTTYSWTVSAPVGINGAVPGIGALIQQTITTTLNVIDTAHYSITPSAAACPGATIIANVLVKPNPQINMAPPSQTVCAGDTSILINLSSNVSGTTYTWTGNATAGISGHLASGSGNIPGMILTNSTVTQGTVTYSAIPTANGCTGNLGQSVITVNPVPAVTNSPMIQQICSGQWSSLVTLTSNVANTQFAWSVIHSGGITGFTGSGTGTIPAQLLVNPGTSPDTVIYHIIPTITAGIACSGIETNYLIIVNPLPVAAFTMSTNIACSPMAITFTNQSTPTTLTYHWNFGNGHTSTLQNPVAAFTNTGMIDSVYTVTLIINMNGTGCADTVSHTVTIHPQPIPGFAFTSVCLGQATNFTNTSVNTLGFINSWNWDFGDGDTSLIQNPSHFYNTSGNFTVTFIVGSSIGCQDTITHSITVYPLPVAGFTHPSHGCIGVAVQFLNTTTGGQNYLWDFGDGYTSNQTNGSHAYANQGHYLVQLISISINGCRDTITDSIHIIQVPTPDFSVSPDNGCAPLPVDIINLSYGDSVSYLWNFGVVPSSTLPGPFNITFPQGLADTTYIVTLAATNMCGTVYHYDSITVYPQPVVNFGMSVNSGCSPILINFYDTIAGMPLVMYWDFGDGSPIITSTTFSQMITHTFMNLGNADTSFTITLIAENGCGLDTMQRTVLVHPNTVFAFFNTDTLSGCKPLTVDFSNFSTQNTQSFWTFGDGNVSNQTSPTHTYLTSGQFVVMLTITNGCSLDTAYSDTITVFPTASVTFTSNNNLCSGDTVFFTSQGSGITNFQWDFGDGGQSTLTNPYHVYTSSGNFPVTLAVDNQYTCAGSSSDIIHVRFRPNASFTAGPPAGCSPFDVQFTNNTDSLTYNTYTWYFDNGGSSVLTNPSQVFSNSSHCVDTVYDVRLIANNSGCADTISVPVTVHPRPVSAFYAQDSVYCSFEVPAIAQFYQQAYCAQGFQWFSDNTGVSNAPDAQIIFPAEGTYNVSLVVANQYQCSDTSAHKFRVYPSLENSLSITPTSGCEPLTVNFNTTIDSIAYSWLFGDNGTSNLPDPTHTYQNPGSYSVTLTVFGNGGCTSSIYLQDTISVYPHATAGFTYQNLNTGVMNDGTIEFINTSSIATIYFWDFGDGSNYTGVDTIHRYTTNGSFEVMLIANNEFNCPDTIIQQVTPEEFHGLFIPNAFSPDNDNELVRVFKPVGIGLKTFLLQVYDTWGNIVWETSALDSEGRPIDAWDGTSQGKVLPMDAYVWTASGTFVDGSVWRGMAIGDEKPKKYGTITIIR